MLDETTREALLDKAEAPGRDAIRLHEFYQGKIEIWPKAAIRDISDFAYWYTPGVAEPCLAIAADPSRSYELTGRGNTVAIVSDGSRVLGLGNIGPEGAMPVMEGKAMIFKYLGGVDAVPICLGTQDIGRLIRAVKYLEPSFGGSTSRISSTRSASSCSTSCARSCGSRSGTTINRGPHR